MALKVLGIDTPRAFVTKFGAHHSFGSTDRSSQTLLYNFYALAAHMETCRSILAKQFEISGPQYSILMVVVRFQGAVGVSSGAVAKLLHVSASFVTAATRTLIDKGLLQKGRDSGNRRIVLLKLTGQGESLIDKYSARIQEINNCAYGSLSTEEFQTLVSLAERVTKSWETTALSVVHDCGVPRNSGRPATVVKVPFM